MSRNLANIKREHGSDNKKTSSVYTRIKKLHSCNKTMKKKIFPVHYYLTLISKLLIVLYEKTVIQKYYHGKNRQPDYINSVSCILRHTKTNSNCQ